MKQIAHNDLLFIDVPPHAYGLMINDYTTNSELMFMVELSESDETLKTIPLPPGKWQIVGRVSEIMESDGGRHPIAMHVGAAGHWLVLRRDNWLDMYKRVGPGKDWWQDRCIISGALIKEYAFQELLAQREQQDEKEQLCLEVHQLNKELIEANEKQVEELRQAREMIKSSPGHLLKSMYMKYRENDQLRADLAQARAEIERLKNNKSKQHPTTT